VNETVQQRAARLVDVYRDAVAARVAHADIAIETAPALLAAEEKARAAIVDALSFTAQQVGALVLAAAEGLEADAGNYLIHTTTERGHGEVYLWWKPKGAGYTRLVEEAGRWDLADLLQQGYKVDPTITHIPGGPVLVKWRDQAARLGDVAVPFDIVPEASRHVVPIGGLPQVKGAPW
jgi:hypothetical protein